MITEKHNDMVITIFNVDDTDDLVLGKKLVEELLIANNTLKEETTIPDFLNNIINISKYVYINDIFGDNTESIGFDILHINNNCYIFITEKNTAWVQLKNHLQNINYDLNQIKSCENTKNPITYILRINNTNYLFNDDLHNENL